ATDHASDSAQVTDLDYIYLDKRFDIPYVPSFIEDWAYDLASKIELGVKSNINAARDMNPVRFAAMHDWIYRPSNGANADALRAFPGGKLASRTFLAGEVDVVPEIGETEYATGRLEYGNDRAYKWSAACKEVPDAIKTLEEW